MVWSLRGFFTWRNWQIFRWPISQKTGGGSK